MKWVRLALLSGAITVAGLQLAGGRLAAQSGGASDELSLLATNPDLFSTARQYFPADQATVAPKRIFRLTRDQIDLSLATLLPGYASQSVKQAMPRDPLQTNYEYAEMIGINAANSGGLAGWIRDIAARVQKNPAGVIDCAVGNNATDCLKTQTRSFVIKAFRGDVSEEKLEQITAFYLKGVQSVGFGQATAELVEVVLSSPHFLFRRETDVGRNNRLTPAQLLQAVTYTLADAPPERLKLNSADAAQYLRNGNEAAATISAIAASTESREKLVRFFKAWLEIRDEGDFTISPQVFPDFTPKLAKSMVDEADRFLRAQLMKLAPRLSDITQSSDTVVARQVAALQTARASDAGAGVPGKAASAQRMGIFSQSAVIASHSGPDGTRPIKRGVFWARKAMCMELEPPPKDLHAKLYELAGATERQRIEQSTQGAACAGCHKIINPFGFFQENYDALGRWRTHDNGHPIDARILIDFLGEETIETSNPVDALKAFTGSMMFKQCFVRQLFRFYMGRTEEAGDEPLLRRMFFTFANDDSQDILKSVYLLVASDRIVRRQ